jgi:hypothetical protein
MTKAQYRVYNRLAKKQVNRRQDIRIVEESASSVTLYITFPGLYLTYGSAGNLLETQTEAERVLGKRPVASGPVAGYDRELGSSDYFKQPVVIDDESSDAF